MSSWTKRSSIGGMVMTRKQGDQIAINRGEVIIEVVEIRGNSVRLAIKANKDIQINRTETLPACLVSPDPKKPER